jgi:hypothetical protein
MQHNNTMSDIQRKFTTAAGKSSDWVDGKIQQ